VSDSPTRGGLAAGARAGKEVQPEPGRQGWNICILTSALQRKLQAPSTVSFQDHIFRAGINYGPSAPPRWLQNTDSEAPSNLFEKAPDLRGFRPDGRQRSEVRDRTVGRTGLPNSRRAEVWATTGYGPNHQINLRTRGFVSAKHTSNERSFIADRAGAGWWLSGFDWTAPGCGHPRGCLSGS